MAGPKKYLNEPIAIVGSACRFPGDATSPSKLWDLLRDPRDVLKEIPDSRFNIQGFYHPDALHHGTTNVRHSYMLDDDHRLFDAQFFGIKPVEANSVDPQQRLLLEVVYEGLESAAIPMEKLQGSRTGVFVGLMTNDYSDLLGRDIDNFPTYFASGTARSIISNRVSYFFDWHGPSMTIDTACSSSLIAVHQAVQSLRAGESCVAVAAGSNLLLGPEQYVAESKLKMLSPTGRCRMWDKDADGYARGEGVAAIILKTLSQALADGDSIECLVRETGINQDGRTKGITMPSPIAQADLIRTTYQKAGLDLSNPSDRPQYFEAHGTGTPAGDPVEAEAVSTAFFGSDAGFKGAALNAPLYVGSIKTVVGHTEGTAGLAGVLKGSLAIQGRTIPPNMLLNELNPSVKPFYGNLQIAKKAKDWPNIPSGASRRVSINSFGFGGANAHAILESYDAPERPSRINPAEIVAALPCILFVAFKDLSVDDLRDLAYTLGSRRSVLPYKISVSASNAEALAAKLDDIVQNPTGVTTGGQGSDSSVPRLLGVFTGQGAQWARMGAELLSNYSMASQVSDRLQEALDSLPVSHRPSWTLKEELMKDAKESRVGQGAFSQPLCTAVQLVLVELLKAANVRFHAVVGHSSGEMAAAYVAGYLSAEDAIRIAYYRGFFLKLAGADGVEAGGMLAAGTSFEDAQELCTLPTLEGRLCVAASNSPTSVTLSGDLDAIQEAKDILEEEEKFARQLKVDKAYHSHHMLSCSKPYIDALRNCGIKIQTPPTGAPPWISSVYGGNIDTVSDSLTANYWSSNMVNPVLFSQAVEYAFGAEGPFDMAVEVGPHPALRGPALDTIKNITGSSIPYTGTLNRGKNSIEAFAESLGALWQSLSGNGVDLAALDRFISGSGAHPPKGLKGLPSYPWEHDRVYWHESRYSKAFRTKGEHPHPLLGTRAPDGTDNLQETRWRNYLHPREVPFLVHHQVQGQIIFPAAGYLSAVVEAVAALYGKESVRLVDFHDIAIEQALILEENAGVETLLTFRVTDRSADTIDALFTFYSVKAKDSTVMIPNASGQLRVSLGEPSPSVLPAPYNPRDDDFLELESERFYIATGALGFGYTGPFQALSDTRRKMDEAVGKIKVPRAEEGETTLIIHPGTLDCAIQSIMLAYCYPGDGRLRSIHLPTGIDRLRINLAACNATAGSGSHLHFYSSVSPESVADLSGDVDLYSADDSHTLLQLQGLHATSLNPPSEKDDVNIFSETIWGPEVPTGRLVKWDGADDYTLSFLMERVAYFYLRRLDAAVPRSERDNLEWHHQRLFAYIEHCLTRVASGTHPYADKAWISDAHSEILNIIQRYPSSIDLRIMHAVGENLPAVIRGEMNMLEPMMADNMLNEFYAHALGMETYLLDMARMVGQLSHRFPHMNLLEIGAGTGGATDMILRQLTGSFSSYTYTDISSGFFEKAQEKFRDHAARITFKVLDIEKDIASQGYQEHSYDLVIASLVLHATRNLEDSLTNARRLLKPGGYLLIVELTDNDPMRFGFIFGGLPGWWLGYEDGRPLSPCVSASKWEELFVQTGFSKIDAITPHNSTFPLPLSVIACQALNDRVEFLRDPPTCQAEALDLESLTIIGGQTSITAEVVKKITDSIGHHYRRLQHVKSVAELSMNNLPVLGSVISLVDLNQPTFEGITAETLRGFQDLFKQSKNILWVTQGAQSENPYRNMIVGMLRTLVLEMTHLCPQFLNFETAADFTVETIMEKILQLEATDRWEQKGEMDSLLWYTEPELSIRDGKVLVPRVKLSPERNQRYNSARRLITRNVETEKSIVSVAHSTSGYTVEEKANEKLGLAERTGIQLSHSLLRAVRITGNDFVFVAVGKDLKSGESVVILTDALDSRVHIPASWRMPCLVKSEEEAVQAMLNLFTHILAQTIVSSIPSGKALAVLNPDYSLGSVLAQRAADRGVAVALLTTKLETCTLPWVAIHPNATHRQLSKALPKNVVKFININGEKQVVSMITECLPKDCKVEDQTSLTRETSQFDIGSSITPIAQQLQTAFMRSMAEPVSLGHCELSAVTVNDLAQKKKPVPGGQAVVQWNGSETVFVQYRSASSQTKFSKDKTYWLVGLTGGLGLSLCQWMAQKGAKYIALSSRNPKIKDAWLQEMASRGCTIRVFANDITHRESVRGLYQRICETMPPVAGVAQGAMVLHDTMFPDLDMERLEKVLRPKVNGSIYLNELFTEPTLEFFVFFSSMAYVTGNAGQSAYAAANSFMSSLASQRRKHNLAGSVINIGAIMGNGYVSRELTLEQQSFLHKVGHQWMSEQDFHEIFAEGVLASQPGSKENAEMSTGLRLQNDDDINWANNPIFQHLVSSKISNLVSADGTAKGGVMMKERLTKATSADDVFDILKEGFILKLQNALQADPSKPMLELSPDELGVDSLVAVDVRSWFLKELGVDMPVLKIINSTSVRELLIAAQQLLPESPVPNVQTGHASDPTPAAEPVVAKVSEPIQTNDDSARSVPEQVTTEGNGAAPTFVEALNASTLGLDTVGNSTTGTSSMDSSVTTNASTSSDISSEEIMTQRVVPMSFGQQRFWFLKSFVVDQTAFNITSKVELRGKLRKDVFQKAVIAVGQRHEALRTFFYTDTATQKHMQGILPSSILRLEYAGIESEKDVDAAIQAMKDHVFDLAQGEILRIQLLSVSSERHFIVLGYHHINMDGISFGVFFSDLEKAYNGTLGAKDMLQYPDFALRQIREYEQGSWNNEISYWRKQFSNLPPPLPPLKFSNRHSRPYVSTFGSHSVNFRMDPALASDIEQSCRRFKANPFHFYFAVFQVLLFRLTDVDDLCIGVADGNRKDADVLQSVGLFLNLLPVRFQRKDNQTFGDTLKDVRVATQEAFANSRVPFDVILTELNVPRSPSHSPLFQAFLNYRPAIEESRTFCGCESEGELIAGGQSAYDLSLDIVDNVSGDNLIMLQVRKDLYSEQDAEALLKMYTNLLRALARNPATRVNWPSLHTREDIDKAVDVGRGVAYRHQWPATVVHRIDDLANAYSSRPALTNDKGGCLTYKQMTRRINALAAELQDQGIARGSRVAVFQTPGLDWVCSLLAILRLGATYIPFDPQVGAGRLSQIAKDCQPTAILIDSVTEVDFFKVQTDAQPINVSHVSDSAVADIKNSAQSSDLAVIMYTSGSTGVPKGIMLSHADFRNNVEISSEAWHVREGVETVLHHSSYTFDMSLCQIFTCLANGGNLLVASSSARGDPVALTELIAQHGVTYTMGTPTEYIGWLRHAKVDLKQTNWRGALTGGEAVSKALVQEFRALKKLDLRLTNSYGPTETTFGCCNCDVPYETVDIERKEQLVFPLTPAPNYSFYVVDENLSPLPVGVPGEVMIGGAGVATGYLNNQELSSKHFLHDKYASDYFESQEWTKVHRSGDQGRLTKDGRLILQGRIKGDTQVKLGGIRIDFEDIESTIVRAGKSHISQAVVSARRDFGSETPYLVAWVIFSKDNLPTNQDQFLNELLLTLPLPQYMRPAIAIALQDLPRMSSGKVDRAAISSFQVTRPTPNKRTPSELTEFEKKVLELWQEALPTEIAHYHDINGQSDFFHVGGSSLALVNLQSLINDQLAISVPLTTLFEASTLSRMAARIQGQESETNTAVIDWEQEVEVPATVSTIQPKKTDKSGKIHRVVVLTGATGFLGKEILRRLLDDDQVVKVHCIAVRKTRVQLPPSLFQNSKITVHQGNLGAPQLGLSDADAEAIFEEADVVVHVGADVSFVKTYNTLKLVNVASTKELVRLSLPHRLPFHFISSASVARLSGKDSFGATSIYPYPPPVDTTDGYTAAKWVSEVYLERVSKETGLPVWIHRPSSISGENTPETDLMSNLMKYAQETKSIPDPASWSGHFDFISVQSAAREIINQLKVKQDNNFGARYIYESGEIELAMDEVQSIMELGTGTRFEILPVEKWVEKAEQKGMNRLLAVYLRQAATGQFLFPRLVQEA